MISQISKKLFLNPNNKNLQKLQQNQNLRNKINFNFNSLQKNSIVQNLSKQQILNTNTLNRNIKRNLFRQLNKFQFCTSTASSPSKQSKSDIYSYQKNLLQFQLNPQQLEELTNRIIREHKICEDFLAQLDIDKWDRSTIQLLLDNQMDFVTQCSSCYFPMYVSNDKDLKKKASEMEIKLDSYSVESSQREDIYQKLKEFQLIVLASSDKFGFTKEELRWLSKEVIKYERNGLNLPKEQKERMGEIKKRISELCTSYSNNLNSDTTKVAFNLEELKGLPEDFINGLQKNEEGQYLVTLQYPDLVPVMQKCQVESTRKKMDYMSGIKGGDENIKMFEEVVKLRQEQAELLGYETFSDYILEFRMAKNKNNVLDFLSELRQKLTPFAEKELKYLIEVKEKYCKINNLEFDGKINSWDFAFYNNYLLDTEYQLDNDKIKQYFPLDVVSDGMFKIYQQILGVRFEKVEEFNSWHEDVTCTAVYDAKTNEFIGQFYLDMHPREGKYGHACVIGAQKSGNRADGERQHPCCIMLCNFTKPTADKPSLLSHSEVETYFHEFGHVMHNICSETPLFPFSCTSVERDFVEAPSQMLENWTYEEKPLQEMSGHYQDLKKHLPKDLLDAIVRAKNVNTGLLNLRQIFFGTYDMTVHTMSKEQIEKFDSKALWHSLRKDIQMIEQQPDTNPSGSFAHLMGGYESGYYGYLWSKVYSADMYEGGFKGDPLNQELGLKYRNSILAPGGSRDGLELIREFLGREPNQNAFLKSIGL